MPPTLEPQWSSCASPPESMVEFTELPGTHTLLVRAIDPSLNVDPTPASYDWTVLGTPITTITAGPPASPATTTATSATFEFAADQAGVTYLCSLDGAEFAPCTSPVTYTAAQLSGLDPPRSGAVRRAHLRGRGDERPVRPAVRHRVPAGRGPAGEPDLDDRRRDGRRRRSSTPARPTRSYLTTATFSFSSNELDATFECRLDGLPVAWEGCSSPAEYAESELAFATGSALGEHTLEVRAIDAALNVDDDAGQLDLDGRPAAVVQHPERHPRDRHADGVRRRDRDA